jgi:hypothetical protein
MTRLVQLVWQPVRMNGEQEGVTFLPGHELENRFTKYVKGQNA